MTPSRPLRFTVVLLSLAAGSLPACALFLGKKPADIIKADAPVVANPAVAGTVDSRVPGVAVNAPSGLATLEAALHSYADDTLCVKFTIQFGASDDQPTRYDDGIEQHYRLFAPTAVVDPYGTPSIAAASLEVLDFDARFRESTYETTPDGRSVKRDRYDVVEQTKVCWPEASRVLTAASAYAMVDFVLDDGTVDFAYAWKF